MPLSDTAIRSIKAYYKSKRVFDGRGLYLEVSPAGGKWWRLKYRFDGKEKRLSLGVYPEVGLKDARERRDECRKLLANGADPGENRKAVKASRVQLVHNSFETVAREWIWATASHCHFNRDFRFNSQSTSMQFTHRKTIGGRAWLSLSLPSEEQEKALVVWANTSFGMQLHWWHSNKQQSGRGSIGKSMLQSLPVLDVTALRPGQLFAAVRLFNTMCTRSFKPLNEIDRDLVRLELDYEFAQNVLKIPKSICAVDGPLQLLREKQHKNPPSEAAKKIWKALSH
jgi:hypothetical protein